MHDEEPTDALFHVSGTVTWIDSNWDKLDSISGKIRYSLISLDEKGGLSATLHREATRGATTTHKARYVQRVSLLQQPKKRISIFLLLQGGFSLFGSRAQSQGDSGGSNDSSAGRETAQPSFPSGGRALGSDGTLRRAPATDARAAMLEAAERRAIAERNKTESV